MYSRGEIMTRSQGRLDTIAHSMKSLSHTSTERINPRQTKALPFSQVKSLQDQTDM